MPGTQQMAGRSSVGSAGGPGAFITGEAAKVGCGAQVKRVCGADSEE